MSTPIGSLGSIRDSATILVKVDQQSPYWYNTVEVILRCPSQQIWYQPLGSAVVQGVGAFEELSFAIPAAIEDKLEGSYDDLEVLVAVNGPAAFTLDQLDFGAVIDGEPPPPPEPEPPGDSYTFSIVTPTGIDIDSIPLIATNKLQLTPFAEVRTATGALAPIVNSGDEQTLFEPDSKSGPVTSVATVELSDRVEIVGDIVSSGEIDTEGKSGIQHDGEKYAETPLQLRESEFEVVFPSELNTTKELMNGVNGEALPGAYARMWVYSGSTLTLSSGRYAIQNFGIEPGAVLLVDDRAGPVHLDVRGQFLFHGSIEKVASFTNPFPNLVLTYVGEQPLVLESAFSGRLVAPFTSLEFATTEDPHRGSFYAENAIIRPFTVVEHHRTLSLVDHIVVSNTTPCSGEAFTVDVEVAASVGNEAVDVSIGTVPGTHRVMIFDGVPGVRFITVAASRGGQIQTQTVEVVVQECEVPQAVVLAEPTPADERVWDIWLEELPPGGARTFSWSFGDGQSQQTNVPVVRHSFAGALDKDKVITVVDLNITVAEAGQPDILLKRSLALGSIYALNRQRGVITPHSSNLWLDYGSTSWRVGAQVDNVEDESLTLEPRTVTYFSCGQGAPEQLAVPAGDEFTIEAAGTETRTFAFPPPTERDGVCALSLHLEGSSASGFSVELNLHRPIPRLGAAHELPLLDQDLLAALNGAAAQGLLTDPNSVTEEELARVSREGYSFQLQQLPGVGEDVQPVPLVSEGEPCVPGSVDRDGLFCAPTDKWWVAPGEIINAQRGDLILSPSCDGVVGTMLAALNPQQYFSHAGIMSEDRQRIFSATTPENRPEDYPNDGDDLPTDGFQEEVLKFGWPGGIDQSANEALYGGFYPEPNPPNKFYRIGPFQVNVRRCVDSEGTVRNIAPTVVKPPLADDATVRPTLHQLVDEVMSTEYLTHYRFFSYTKATLATERNAQGELLHRANGPFDGPTQWAEGTLPAVCSTILWAAAHRLQEQGATFVLEGPGTEPSDIVVRGRNGTEPVELGTLDGLYHYSESERAAAARAFYDKVYDKVAAKGDPLGVAELFSDVGDDIATQSTMCFARDRCSQDDKDADADEWLAPGTGDTVSPDNLLLWDAPPDGLYGSVERMMLIGSRIRRQFEWQPIANDANLTVRVFDQNGALQPGATVVIGGVLAGNERTLVTNAAGEARFEHLGVGAQGTEYPITASFVTGQGAASVPALADQVHSVGTSTVLIPNSPSPEPQEVQVDVNLEGGDPAYRRAVIRGSLHVLDNDGTDPGDDETGDWDDLLFERDVGPFGEIPRINVNGQAWCVDGEVLTRLIVDFAYVDQAVLDAGQVQVAEDIVPVPADTPIGSIVARFYARLWESFSVFDDACDDPEGADEETPDIEFVIVPPGQTLAVPELQARNNGQGDEATYTLEIENVGQPGSFPLPPPGEDPNLDPKRRLIRVTADHHIVDGETDGSEVNDGQTVVDVVVDPWNPIGECTKGACAGDEVRGDLVARARLLEDLESVEVALFARVFEGTSCNGDPCGEALSVVVVPRDATVVAPNPLLRVTCDSPVFNNSDSRADYTDIVVQNLQAPDGAVWPCSPTP